MNRDEQGEPTIELELRAGDPADGRDAKIRRLNHALESMIIELESYPLLDAA